MELKTMRCPTCNAPLAIDPENPVQYCPYCNCSIHYEDDSIRIKIKHDIKHDIHSFDEARISEAQAKRDIKIAKSNNSVKKSNNVVKVLKGIGIFYIVILVISLPLTLYFEAADKKQIEEYKAAGMICAGDNSDYKDIDYTAAVEKLESLGFTNVKAIDQDKKDNSGKVESVSINGSDYFSDDEYFEPDSVVVVMYK